MELELFIENIAEQFEETDSSLFSPNTEFKNLDEWSSLMALSLIATVDENYNVKLKGDDIKNSNTILDLFEIVKSKL